MPCLTTFSPSSVSSSLRVSLPSWGVRMSEPRERKVKDTLDPLTRARRKRSYVVLDIETKDGAPGTRLQARGFTRPFLAGVFDGTTYLDWYGDKCLKRMLDYLIRPEYSGSYFYAHNGGGFDYLHLLPLLAAKEGPFQVEIIPVASTIQAIRVTRGRYRWTFLDSYKLIPASLEKAGKALGTDLRKQEGFDYDTPEDDPRWKEYLELDCRALYEIIGKFHNIIEDELGGEVGVTLASTSMLTFRRGYLKAPIQRCIPTHEFVRKGYYGGNTQMFRREVTGLHCYDINSSYPAAMLGPVPVAYHREFFGKPAAQFQSNTVGFVRAVVTWPKEVLYPSLPFRGLGGKLLYPGGRLEGVWCHEELLLAEEMGAQVLWLEGQWFHAAPVLRGYMEKLYSYRDPRSPAYNETLSFVAKLLGNSCFGKFSQHLVREKILILKPGEDYPVQTDKTIPKPRQAVGGDDCLVWYVYERSDADYIIPQIGATITARARIQLQRAINEAHRRGGVVAYCDTDSIMTTANLSDWVGQDLGQLKDEGQGATFTGTFAQPKLYRLINERTGRHVHKMKGFTQAYEGQLAEGPGNRRLTSEEAEDMNKALFSKVMKGEAIYRQKLEKMGRLASLGFSRGPMMREVMKTMRSHDTKRQWHEDGSSSPLILDEE